MTSDEKRLRALFARLAPAGRSSLIAYAERLAARGAADSDSGGLNALPRPAVETVAKAIQRLVRTYPMLERRRLLAESSRLMAQHALDGREASAVIDDLEAAFARHYRQHSAGGDRRKERG